MNDGELDSVLEAAASSSGKLMVGFNRRFSPLAKTAVEFFRNRQSPLSILYRVNAGRIPRNSWIQDEKQGGGRIVGEVSGDAMTENEIVVYATGVKTQAEAAIAMTGAA